MVPEQTKRVEPGAMPRLSTADGTFGEQVRVMYDNPGHSRLTALG